MIFPDADFLQITTDNGFGIIDVGEIDRDMRKNEVYRFKVSDCWLSKDYIFNMIKK